MNVAFLVPRRADGGRRDDLWTFCRDWWSNAFPAWKIVEGHHDEGPFNRSAAINRAAADAGPWDVAIVCDADVVADPAQLAAAVKSAAAEGRATLAYDRYIALDRAMTSQVIAGFAGDWARRPQLKMDTHFSSLVVVPRELWNVTGGFDERFEGWGAEDLAFAAACRVLGGGIDRIAGTVFHLHHDASPERDRRSPLYLAGAMLAKRYAQTIDPPAMRQLIAEREEPDGVCLVVITDGRRDCIVETIDSALGHLVGLPIVRRIICDDSADLEYHAWLRLTFPEFDLVCGGRRQGFAGNVRTAWAAALGSGQRWVFWLEDDFVFERAVDLAAMARVLDDRPHLLQMALRRQAWFPGELAAGGVVEQNPDAYDDVDDGESRWLEHGLFWTTNPHLVSRRVLAENEWPNKPHSESLFARKVLNGATRCGYWGERTDDPWVTHIGERSGVGY